MARRKINTPAIEDHTQEEKENMQVENTQVEEKQVEEKQVEEKQVEEKEHKQEQEEQKQEEQYVTLDQVAAYDPEKINAALAEIDANHETVNKMVKKLPDSAIVSMREVLGITDNIDVDRAAIRAKLGGTVASLIDDLKQGEKWDRVVEYTALLQLVDQVNETRRQIGLPILSIKIGGRMSGASSSMNGNISPRRSGGYMLPGTYEMSLSKCKVKFTVTAENILVTVNDIRSYSGKQGTVSLSMILNEHILPACGHAPESRMSFPKFIRDNGFDPDRVMLHAPPSVKVEK